MANEELTPKEDADIALEFYRDLTGESRSVSLEEVEQKGNCWYITLFLYFTPR